LLARQMTSLLSNPQVNWKLGAYTIPMNEMLDVFETKVKVMLAEKAAPERLLNNIISMYKIAWEHGAQSNVPRYEKVGEDCESCSA
jgi:hypothetical protein